MREVLEQMREIYEAYPKIDPRTIPGFDDTAWQGDKGFFRNEIHAFPYNVSIIVHGGREYNYELQQMVSLYIPDKYAYGSTNSFSGLVTRSRGAEGLVFQVQVGAIEFGAYDAPFIRDMEYLSSRGGRLLEGTSMSIPSSREYRMTPKDFRRLWVADMTEKGVYLRSELPKVADTERTVYSFVDQLRRRDYARAMIHQPQAK